MHMSEKIYDAFGKRMSRKPTPCTRSHFGIFEQKKAWKHIHKLKTYQTFSRGLLKVHDDNTPFMYLSPHMTAKRHRFTSVAVYLSCMNIVWTTRYIVAHMIRHLPSQQDNRISKTVVPLGSCTRYYISCHHGRASYGTYFASTLEKMQEFLEF